jgi:hypothetical protein
VAAIRGHSPLTTLLLQTGAGLPRPGPTSGEPLTWQRPQPRERDTTQPKKGKGKNPTGNNPTTPAKQTSAVTAKGKFIKSSAPLFRFVPGRLDPWREITTPQALIQQITRTKPRPKAPAFDGKMYCFNYMWENSSGCQVHNCPRHHIDLNEDLWKSRDSFAPLIDYFESTVFAGIGEPTDILRNHLSSL